MEKEPEMDVMEGELCPFCNHKTLTLTEAVRDIPFFGVCHLFSMDCTTCKYHKADLESEKSHDPVRYTYDISSEDDMKIRVVKSGSCDVKVPYVGDIIAGSASNGYVTNVEGILNRLLKQVEHLRDSADDPSARKKAKNLVKKLTRILWGQEKAKLILEDPTGNSAIISPDAKKDKLKR
ncbi:ZPR1 zinc finger domain-containing protein [Candidatus Woesearchaeota archaeon]|nr:ZPR1 zinc finger domain-containing protein [Candidatus Woesearchaeota archaeon]